MKRHHQILLGILAVQIILSVIVFWPRSAATGQSEPLFADLASDDIVGLTIADAEGKSIALRKVTGEWVLPEADDYPAQADKVTPLLEDIVGLTTARLVTRTAASHKQLQVAPDDFQRRIEFETADGAKQAFYLGSSPSYGATHFRRADRNETYLTNDITIWEANVAAASWIDTVYLSVPQEDVTKMTLENGNGTFVFTKDDAGQWSMAGLAEDEILDDVKVGAAVRQAAAVTMLRPLGKEAQAAYGMDAPQAEVTLETDEKTITLRVGAQDPTDKSYVVISSESPYYVRGSEYTGRQWVEKTGEDFLQVEPTPTPEDNTSSS
ncbi:MAG: DUF4340 domain-containing protein [Chloroflexi bacterium]|nr:DUF4340 domain-containing protein [Chloroflexota bacterium]